MGSTGANKGSTVTASKQNIEPSDNFTRALFTGKTREVGNELKSFPVGTELEFRVNGIPRTYTRVEGTGASVWKSSISDRVESNSTIAGYLIRSSKNYSTLAQFYENNLKIRR